MIDKLLADEAVSKTKKKRDIEWLVNGLIMRT